MLKFINNAAFLLSVSALVSIHPMLKFIYCEHFSLKLLNTCFNTSHVKVYLTWLGVYYIRHRRFNTSHVKVYPCCPTDFKFNWLRFNTSHVKVYPTHFLHFIQSTISDFSVFINILKIFTSRRTLCQKIHKIVAMSLFLRIHAILH